MLTTTELRCVHHEMRRIAILQKLVAPVTDGVGWVIETETTFQGRKSYRTSPIYRRRSDAEVLVERPVAHLPCETVRRVIIRVRTAWPLAVVLAGQAEAWEEEVATASEATVPARKVA